MAQKCHTVHTPILLSKGSVVFNLSHSNSGYRWSHATCTGPMLARVLTPVLTVVHT